MIIQPETVLRDTAIALLPMLVAGFVVGGWFGALGTLATGAFVLLNLWVLGKLIRRVTGYLAGEDPQGSLAVAFLRRRYNIFTSTRTPSPTSIR